MLPSIRQIYSRPQPSGDITDHGGVPGTDMKVVAAEFVASWVRILANVGTSYRLSILKELHGLPYPIAYRNHGAVEGWRRAIHSTRTGRQYWHLLENQDSSAVFCIAPLNAVLEKVMACMQDCSDADGWRSTAANMALQVGVNIAFECKRGTIIESTPALETLLTHADVDVTLPMGMFAPPFAAQYVHFGPEAARVLRCPGCRDDQIVFDGVFCFLSQSPNHPGVASERELELIFVGKHNDRYSGYYLLRAPVGASDKPVVDWIDAIFKQHEGPGHEEIDRLRLLEAVSFVVKLFLYLGLKDARQVVQTAYSQTLKKMAHIGPKKRAKVGRQIKSLYDRITVGPTTLSANPAPQSSGHSMPPHWRRGHFRMQFHGPGRQERKLIFVAPMMVRADKLNDATPRPKTYRATD